MILFYSLEVSYCSPHSRGGDYTRYEYQDEGIVGAFPEAAYRDEEIERSFKPTRSSI